MTACQTVLILLAVIALAVVPLMVIKAEPDAQGNVPEIFLGADDKAKSVGRYLHHQGHNAS